MTEHPDIVAMSARYDRMAESITAQATDALTVLAGLFVALSPWIVGFTDTSAGLARNNLVIGLAVAALGASFALAYERTHRLIWVCPLLGVWTIVAVWLVSGAETTTATVLSNVIGGAVVTALGLIAMVPMFLARRSAR
ncbi:MAG: hypothetical protein GEV00_05945 [Actinophytocola sp.]|nr:hypothetical protein [Actinophytocola sp.]